MNLRKVFLLCVLASLAAAAGVGVWAIVFDINVERWLMSMFSIALFSLLSLGAAGAIERGVWVRPMAATIAFCVFGVVLFLYGVWSGPHRYDMQAVPNLMWLTGIWTSAVSIAGTIAITRFRGVLSLLRIAGLACVFVLATMLSVAVLAEPRGDAWDRSLGVVAIGSALAVVGLPVLHKVWGERSPDKVVTSPLELCITCPRCLLAQTVHAGESRCSRCRLKIKLDIEEPRCPECNYLLYRLTTPRCPECGHALASDDVESTEEPSHSSASADGR